MTRVLVTGGTGFIGRALVRRLVAAGVSVQLLSRSNRSPPDPRVWMHRGDLTRLEDLRAAIQGCDAVFHCAGEKSDPARMFGTNVTATRLLFELAREVGLKYFCHLSSVGVIGKTRLRVVDETTPCHPMNTYEETKLQAEGIVSDGLDGGSVVILRPTNVFGAETIRPWLDASLRSQARLWLTGRENSHLVYVEDVAAAAMHCLQYRPAERVATFIVSSDEDPGNSNREVRAALCSEDSRRLAWSAPLFMPFCVRLLRHGSANFGDKIYSSRRLLATGFQFPYGLRAGLRDAMTLARAQAGPAGCRSW